MPELLFELGCEELPASSVGRAFKQLEQEISNRLDSAGLAHGASLSMGTPRRLIVQVLDVADRQPDSEKTQRGPSLSSAYDESGSPTKALQGFCRGQGVDPSEVEKKDDYVWVTKKVIGLPASEVLSEVLPAAVRALTFDKTMRWGSSKMRFARPIRWMLASLGGSLVPFEIEGVASGLESRGHRFNSPSSFEATSFSTLVEQLRERQVEPDPTEREKRIREGAAAATSGTPDMPTALVDENVHLTEWPEPLEGTFPKEYMELPEPVLVTAMAKHERFFPVRDDDGKLTNSFISVRNGGREDDVRKGNQWVLNARFNDAKFFFDEDAHLTMDDFLAKTERMTFADRLGNVRQRADRLSALAGVVAKATGADKAEINLAKKAGLYAKADLSSGLVSELASLQGVVGGIYATRDGFEDDVALAITKQYSIWIPESDPDDPQTELLPTPARRIAVRLLMADQLDKLAGYLGIDEAPSGSSDPYALRRAATFLIATSEMWNAPFGGYRAMFDAALSFYSKQGIELDNTVALDHLAEVFASRYDSLNQSASHDAVDAAQLDRSSTVALDPRLFAIRLACMEYANTDTEFVQAATRPINIVIAAEKKSIDVPEDPALEDIDRTKLDSSEGDALLDATTVAKSAVESALAEEQAKGVVIALRELKAPIDAFFDSTMVMVDDEAVRDERLKMLKCVSNLLLQAGDFTKIVIEG